jgi:hypothetical protein
MFPIIEHTVSQTQNPCVTRGISIVNKAAVKIGPEIPAPPPEEIPKPKRETKPKWEPKKESPAGRKKRLREEQLHDWDTESYKGAARPSDMFVLRRGTEQKLT